MPGYPYDYEHTEFPYILSLYGGSPTNETYFTCICLASYIAFNWALTTASCESPLYVKYILLAGKIKHTQCFIFKKYEEY